MNGVADRILEALGSHGEWVSSAQLVKGLKVSRMAVSKQVSRLRRLGYDIESSPRRGYRLAARTELAAPEEVVPLLRTRVVGQTYKYFAEISSTNDFLRAHAGEYPDGTAVAAGSQTQGRGRFQRDWFSPPGVNVYLSVLLKPAVSPLLAPQLSLVAAAAVLRALHALGCAEARVKWPNDVLWREKKLAGILCEMDAEADIVRAVVIGIGVNANLTAFPPSLKKIAASLRQAVGHPVSVPALTAEILNSLDALYEGWLRNGLAETVALLNQHSMLSGREVAIGLSREKIRGRVQGITEAGLLRLVQANGTARDITSGEVLLCRARTANTRTKKHE